ncbi:MAG: hypothetical protein L6R37_004650 [Teloschistes peruensis]|nr:MAG: hypothetical protein L6R37_004650 [Teloschistes peruensis]
MRHSGSRSDSLLGPAQALEKRLSDSDDDIDPDAATDPLRRAVNHRSVFFNQATVTYSAISTGALPASAQLAATTTVPGNIRPRSPPDPTEQGTVYVVDHILELQFVVGAFQVNPQPDTQEPKVQPRSPMQTGNLHQTLALPRPTAAQPIASAFAGLSNLQSIANRFNGFKGQVFTGRIRNQPSNPSGNTYPSDFGPALQKFFRDNQQAVYAVIDGVGNALGDAGGHSAIKPNFMTYAQNEYISAINFLSYWTGTSYTAGGVATSIAANTMNAEVTASITTSADGLPTIARISTVAPATTTTMQSNPDPVTQVQRRGKRTVVHL